MTKIDSMDRFLVRNLISWKEKKTRKPLILKGVRQCGKTTLLKRFGKENFAETHYFNFEEEEELEQLFKRSLNPKHLLKELSFFQKRQINIDNDLVIFDEIQACPRALTSLKYFCEDLPEMAVCSAGSLLGIHLNEVSFPVGKVDWLHMKPMSFEEFLWALDEEQSLDILEKMDWDAPPSEYVHSYLWEKLKHYFAVGGMPEVVADFVQHQEELFLAFERVRTLQKGLIDSYLADIAKHSGKINALRVSRVWRSVPLQLSQNHDSSSSKFKFKGVVSGIDRYSRLAGPIDWLEAAELIIRVPIVNSGNLPLAAYSQENAFKLYMADVGLLGAMIDLNPNVILKYEYGSYKGYFAENFIAQAIDKQLYSWQERKAEVEFLYDDEGKIIPIEVKSGWVTKAKSLKIFSDKYNSAYRVVFSANNLSKSDHIHRYPLYLAERFPLRPDRRNVR